MIICVDIYSFAAANIHTFFHFGKFLLKNFTFSSKNNTRLPTIANKYANIVNNIHKQQAMMDRLLGQAIRQAKRGPQFGTLSYYIYYLIITHGICSKTMINSKRPIVNYQLLIVN